MPALVIGLLLAVLRIAVLPLAAADTGLPYGLLPSPGELQAMTRQLRAGLAADGMSVMDAQTVARAVRVTGFSQAVPNRAWLEDFPNIVQALKAQAAVAYIISVFSLIASAFAIAAILIVSVLRKAKQIGILMSMGARRAQIRRIFIFEGLGIALLGSSVGAAVAIGFLRLLMLIEQPIRFAGEKPQSLFPIVIMPAYIIIAMAAAILTTVIAAWLPARNAANLNPVEVMR